MRHLRIPSLDHNNKITLRLDPRLKISAIDSTENTLEYITTQRHSEYQTYYESGSAIEMIHLDGVALKGFNACHFLDRI